MIEAATSSTPGSIEDTHLRHHHSLCSQSEHNYSNITKPVQRRIRTGSPLILCARVVTLKVKSSFGTKGGSPELTNNLWLPFSDLALQGQDAVLVVISMYKECI